MGAEFYVTVDGKEKYGCWYTLAILATHPNVPENVLEVLNRSEDSSVRSNANADSERRAMYFEHYKVKISKTRSEF